MAPAPMLGRALLRHGLTAKVNMLLPGCADVVAVRCIVDIATSRHRDSLAAPHTYGKAPVIMNTSGTGAWGLQAVDIRGSTPTGVCTLAGQSVPVFAKPTRQAVKMTDGHSPEPAPAPPPWHKTTPS